MTEPQPESCATEPQDGCAVDTEPLAAIVCRFVEGWEKTRPKSGGGRFNGPSRSRADKPLTLTAIEWLSSETGLPPEVLEPLARPPRAPRPSSRKRKERVTELRIADRIVSALDIPEAYHDGTLTIRGNPRAPKALQASCCSGSS